MPYVMPEKDPQAELDYTVDLTDWLPSGDTISAGTWVVPTGITQSQAISNTTVKSTIWLSGGTDKADYDPIFRVVTANGRKSKWSITIPVRQK